MGEAPGAGSTCPLLSLAAAMGHSAPAPCTPLGMVHGSWGHFLGGRENKPSQFNGERKQQKTQQTKNPPKPNPTYRLQAPQRPLIASPYPMGAVLMSSVQDEPSHSQAPTSVSRSQARQGLGADPGCPATGKQCGISYLGTPKPVLGKRLRDPPGEGFPRCCTDPSPPPP